MAKQNEQIGDKVQDTQSIEKKLEFLCKKGEFRFYGHKYHHDTLDLETAQMLIDKGYPYLKIR